MNTRRTPASPASEREPKSIADLWCDFRMSALAKDATPRERRWARLTFYAGAYALLMEIQHQSHAEFDRGNEEGADLAPYIRDVKSDLEAVLIPPKYRPKQAP